MIQRSYYKTLSERIEEPRKFIQVLYGPRQVGKTTLVSQYLKQTDIPYVFETADDIVGADSTWLRQVWSRTRQLAKQAGRDFLLVVDEVQKVSNWIEVVKKEWDTDTFNETDIKVVLLGSSSLLIQQGLTESLAGRYEATYIPHWSFAEMNEAFGMSVEDYVWFGGYPGSASIMGDEQRWKRYVRDSLIETSISKDVLMLTRIDKPILLKRLFEIGCLYSAQILSLTKVQGELMEKGNITTLGNYLGLLDSAGLLCGLEKYAGDIIRKRASKPKFQVYNNALMSAQDVLGLNEVRRDGKAWGRYFESAVGTHLLNASKTSDFNLYYWNDNSQEVDYVLERGGRTVAIEVKSGKDSTNVGMSIFDKMYHPVRLYTIGTDGMPIEEFLRIDPIELFN